MNIYVRVFSLKKENLGFAKIVIFIDDLNIVRTLEEIPHVANCLRI